MSIRVWHNAEPCFFDRGITTVARGEFRLAATVDTNEKGIAFMLTNTIDCYWPNNPGVHAEKAPGPSHGWRSTSVGDVMETTEGFFLVANIGFRKVDMIDG